MTNIKDSDTKNTNDSKDEMYAKDQYRKPSIILVGMPGAGKSTIGPMLAKQLDYTFKDTDIIVQQFDGRALRDIVQQDGFEAFMKIQDKALISELSDSCVIATGGSVIKSPELMNYLKELGKIIYLKVDESTLEKRMKPGRRLARADGQTYRQVFEEREPLYRKYADKIILCDGKYPLEITNEIIINLNNMI